MSKLLLSVFILINGLAFGIHPEDDTRVAPFKQDLIRELSIQILNSVGTYQHPEIQVVGGDVIAEIVPGNPSQLFIGERIYDICVQAFQQDSMHAMAAILGHELAHFILGHKKSSGFAKKAEVPELEAEADMHGAFYAFLAGYKTFEIYPRVLEVLYDSLDLAHDLENYPPLEERKKAAQKMLLKAENYAKVYDAGKFLYLYKNFRSAAVCFDHIAYEIPIAEVFNNAAVSKMALASKLIDHKKHPFALPFELDATNRLRLGLTRTGGGGSKEKMINSLLEKAEKDLNTAIERNPAYLSAYINKACVAYLQGNYPKVIGIETDIRKTCEKYQLVFPANAYSILGMAKLASGLRAEARKDFNRANELNAYMAAFNLAVFEKIDQSLVASFVDYLGQNWRELNVYIRGYLNENHPQHRNRLKEKHMFPISFRDLDQLEYEKLMVVTRDDITIRIGEIIRDGFIGIRIIYPYDPTTEYAIDVISTPSNYVGRTEQGLKIGSSIAAVDQAYGKAPFEVAGSNGKSYQLFRNEGLWMETDQTIKSWGIIQQKIYFR